MSRSSKRNLSNLERRLKKAERLVESGAVRIIFQEEGAFVFLVRGDTDEHHVIYRDGRWMCDCEFNSLYPMHPCSHILACQLFLEKKRRENQ